MIDVEGGGGPLTLFHAHRHRDGIVKLESVKFGGYYVAIKRGGHVDVGSGGPHCALRFFREGGPVVVAAHRPHHAYVCSA